MKKICSKCNIEKDFTEFRGDKSKRDGVQSYCKVCARQEYNTAYPERYATKARVRMRARREGATAGVQAIKRSLGCKICGEQTPCCLEFHHLDPTQKEFAISHYISGSMDLILEEIKKCVCLCSNCHKKVHAGLLTV